MVDDAAERVSEFLRDRVGDGLRTIVVVTEDGWRMAYLREDLKAEYDREGYSAVVDTFRLEGQVLAPETEGLPVGERRALVHYHENAFVIQIPFSRTESLLISLNDSAGASLMGFIEAIRDVVGDE